MGRPGRQDLDRAGEKIAGNQPHGGQQEHKEQEGGGQRQGLAQGQARQAGEGPGRQDGGGQKQPQERQQAPQPAQPHPGGFGPMPAAARQTAQPGPQQPGPQPQGQLQLLTLGQNHQLPQDQHLGDHGPGPVDQDDALESCNPQVIQITLVPKLHLGTHTRRIPSFPSCTWERNG